MEPFVNVAGSGNVRFLHGEKVTVQLSVFAQGYRHAARALTAQFTADSADFEGYPILFLYRHSLELYLKAFVYRGADLLGLLTGRPIPAPGLFSKHDFARLGAPTREILNALHWNLQSAGFPTFDAFDDFLRRLDALDHGSYVFRYPVDRSGSPVERPTVNIPAFARVVDPILGYFEGAVAAADDRWEAVHHARKAVGEFIDSECEA